MKIKLLLFVFLFSYNLYSQSLTNEIVLDSNGVTIKCKDSETGFTKNIAGKIYTVVDEALLRNMVNNDEDVTCVCTSNITDMSELFMSKPSFNQDIISWDTSSVTTMKSILKNAQLFNQDLGS